MLKKLINGASVYPGAQSFVDQSTPVVTTSPHASHFDVMDKALGLTRPGELTYESICAKVKPIDEARDKKAMDSGLAEIYEDIMARATTKAMAHS